MEERPLCRFRHTKEVRNLGCRASVNISQEDHTTLRRPPRVNSPGRRQNALVYTSVTMARPMSPLAPTTAISAPSMVRGATMATTTWRRQRTSPGGSSHLPSTEFRGPAARPMRVGRPAHQRVARPSHRRCEHKGPAHAALEKHRSSSLRSCAPTEPPVHSGPPRRSRVSRTGNPCAGRLPTS